MLREISAGGAVVRPTPQGWELAVIEPQGDNSADQKSDKKRHKQVLALPKGLLDPGEKPAEAAVREVTEETGLTGRVLVKLADIKYVYVRSWGDKQRVFKIVSFYLLRYVSGTIDDVSPEMRVEVNRALWIPLAEAEKRLAYRGERDVVRRVQEYLNSHKEEAQS
jgi:8-oxo-dGTP pyrophosphatase MutT (NUDIX family)